MKTQSVTKKHYNRRVRRVTVYVCTLDGSIHNRREDAKARAAKLDAPPKVVRKVKKSSFVLEALRAVEGGARRAVTVRDQTNIPPRLVHPTLSNLCKRGLLKRTDKGIELTRAGKARLAEGA